jgi:putative ABC transport system ATP-binding protein
MSILKCKNVCKKFKDGENDHIVLKSLDLNVHENEFVSIMGKSGSGKTTLLNIIGGLDKPDEGSVIIDGKDITTMNDDECSKFRRRNIGFVFQSYNLIPILNVEENIRLLVDIDDIKTDEVFLKEIISALGLEKLLSNMPNKLSGGEKQRVAIARAMLSKPKIVIADEPTGNLDEKNSENVLTLLRKAKQRFNQTIILVTHDPMVAGLADRNLVLVKGKLNGKQ